MDALRYSASCTHKVYTGVLGEGAAGPGAIPSHRLPSRISLTDGQPFHIKSFCTLLSEPPRQEGFASTELSQDDLLFHCLGSTITGTFPLARCRLRARDPILPTPAMNSNGRPFLPPAPLRPIITPRPHRFPVAQSGASFGIGRQAASSTVLSDQRGGSVRTPDPPARASLISSNRHLVLPTAAGIVRTSASLVQVTDGLSSMRTLPHRNIV